MRNQIWKRPWKMWTMLYEMKERRWRIYLTIWRKNSSLTCRWMKYVIICNTCEIRNVLWQAFLTIFYQSDLKSRTDERIFLDRFSLTIVFFRSWLRLVLEANFEQKLFNKLFQIVEFSKTFKLCFYSKTEWAQDVLLW